MKVYISVFLPCLVLESRRTSTLETTCFAYFEKADWFKFFISSPGYFSILLISLLTIILCISVLSMAIRRYKEHTTIFFQIISIIYWRILRNVLDISPDKIFFFKVVLFNMVMYRCHFFL